MLGFSMEQLLVVAAACMLILGPQKTLAAAYWLGSRFGRLRKLLDECRRELDVAGVTDLKQELSPRLSSLREQTMGMSQDLKNAMREAAPDLKTAATAKAATTSVEKPAAETKGNTAGTVLSGSECRELLARLGTLEKEIAGIKRRLNAAHEELTA